MRLLFLKSPLSAISVLAARRPLARPREAPSTRCPADGSVGKKAPCVLAAAAPAAGAGARC